MSEDVIDLNRERFNRIDAKLDRILDAIGQLTSRVESLESQFLGFRRDQVDLRADVVRLDHRLDS